tara:strand:- start:6928 stop:7341 length:414 start_codon:yes stop_codon:yes gene_type:complete
LNNCSFRIQLNYYKIKANIVLKGALTSVILMFIFIPIPIVHFFAVPLSPFIGGFIGGSIAKAEKEKIIFFSFLTTGITAIPSIFIIIYSLIQRSNQSDVAGMDPILAMILAIVLIPYTWFGNLVGALISYTARAKSN